MAKKNKMRFIDLDDVSFKEENSSNMSNKANEEFNTNITLDDLVETKQTIQEQRKQKNEINKRNEDTWIENTSLSKEDFQPFTKIEKNERKINYEVNFDDILNENSNNKILNSFYDNNQKSDFNKINNQNFKNNNNNEYRNLKPRNTTKTFNEALRNQERMMQQTSFEENKIKQFLTIKEKLDVKTNIYLKSSIVIKLKELEEKTNESRSSIINKLIEIALKNMEE